MIGVLVSTATCAEDALPRVLMLGDSVTRDAASQMAKDLKGELDIIYAKWESGEVASTTTALEKLDRLLGDQKWDVIYFNFGLGDLVYVAPGMKSFRVLPIHVGGVRATSPQQYEQNLGELVDRLQRTEAKLIWGNTTPIRHSTPNIFELGSEVEYNAIAAKIMAQHNVPICDMYSYVRELIDMNKPASHGADPFFFDRKPIHPPMVAAVRSALAR